MNTDDLYDYYSRPGDPATITRESAKASVDLLMESFAGWDEDQIAAMILDLSMMLATKRGHLGKEAMIIALNRIDMLLTAYQQARREMN
jgi:hypothetical protein